MVLCAPMQVPEKHGMPQLLIESVRSKRVPEVACDASPVPMLVKVREIATGDRLKLRLLQPTDEPWSVYSVESRPNGNRQLNLVRGARLPPVDPPVHPSVIVSMIISDGAMLTRLPPQPEPPPFSFARPPVNPT